MTGAGGAPAGGGSSYSYDGEGRRVRKVVGSVTSVFVYDAMGKLVAEYGGVTQASGTSYVTPDHLGSARVVTGHAAGQSLVVKGRHDYLPFGEEIHSGRAGYGGNEIRQKFAGYERDAETELDFAQARYYAPVAGRFTSVDPLAASANTKNPQTFNRYAYVLNSPHKLTDPLGLKPCGASPNGGPAVTCTQADDLPPEVFNAALARHRAGRAAQGYIDYTSDLTALMSFVACVPEPQVVSFQIRALDGDSLSPGNPKRFPGSNRPRSLGPAKLIDRWGWQVEFVAVVTDDVSTWTIWQEYETSFTIDTVDFKGELVTRTEPDGPPIREGFPSIWVHQPKGGRRLYAIDAPGIGRESQWWPADVVVHRRMNFTTHLARDGIVHRSIRWSVSLTATKDKLISAEWFRHHIPLK